MQASALMLLLFTTTSLDIESSKQNVVGRDNRTPTPSTSLPTVKSKLLPTESNSFDPNGYISYIPHSGFNNQRIQLENALTIASILNKTLILPPLYFGRFVAWWPHYFLIRMLTEHETKSENGVHESIVPWRLLFGDGLKSLQNDQIVKIISIGDFVARTHSTFVDTTSSELPQVKIFRVRDYSRYSFRVVDKLFFTPTNISDVLLYDNMERTDQAFTIPYVPTVVDGVKGMQPKLVDHTKQNFLRMRIRGKHRRDEELLRRVWEGRKEDIADTNDIVFLHVTTESFYKQNVNDTVIESTNNTFAKQNIAYTKSQLVSAIAEIKGSKIDAQFNETGLTITYNLERYSHTLNLQGLMATSPNKNTINILQFGSLFGQSRLQLLDPTHQSLMSTITSRLSPFYTLPSSSTKPSLLSIMTKTITSQLEQQFGQYLFSVHLRVGDGTFRDQYRKNVRETLDKLVVSIRDYSIKNKQVLSRLPNNVFSIFVATDQPRPRNSRLWRGPLARFTTKLQATLNETGNTNIEFRLSFLTDFTEAMDAFQKELNQEVQRMVMNDEGADSRCGPFLMKHYLSSLAYLSQYSSSSNSQIEVDSTNIEFIRRFSTSPQFDCDESKRAKVYKPNLFPSVLAALMDLLVASQAKGVFVGTDGSTFSSFARRIHDQTTF